MLTMYDTITVDTVPADATIVAGYVSGSWPTYEPLRQRFPHARVMSIAPEANYDAECLDVEPFDATNSQAPGWVSRQHARGLVKPVLYTSASNTQSLVNALAASGITRDRYRVWSAHYTNSPHVCTPGGCGYPQADGTQWTQTALGRNLDQSLLFDSFFGPPPPPPDPNHYGWFQSWELPDVKEYDKLRARGHGHVHPHHRELEVLRKSLRHRATSVYVRAYFDPETGKRIVGKPDWNLYRRGWRFGELSRRSKGEQLVRADGSRVP